jgi:putative oxidoreductase
MHGSPQETLWLLGRLLLGGLFVVAGIRHFFVFGGVQQAIAARGVPFAGLVLVAGSGFELLAGTLLMAGVAVVYAALGLALFTAAASVMLLNFWGMEGAAREAAINAWQSNLAVVGGLLVAAAHSLQASH